MILLDVLWPSQDFSSFLVGDFSTQVKVHVSYISMQNLGGPSIPNSVLVHVNFFVSTYNHPHIEHVLWSRAQRGSQLGTPKLYVDHCRTHI